MLLQLFTYAVFIVAGLTALYFGAEFLLRGAVSGSLRLGISKLVIGLTVVAFGTSAPEMVVSVISAVQGHASIAVGNVIGSNIINIALVLGLLSLWLPVESHPKLLRFDIPVMFGSYGVMLLFVFGSVWPLQTGTITRIEGLLLLFLLGSYLVTIYVKSRRKGVAESAVPIDAVEIAVETPSKEYAPLVIFALMLGGILLLGIGGELVVRGAVWYAGEVFFVSERVIGITIVAFATSLPELTTSLVAIKKKEVDISLGNIIGSNIFNSLGVLGIAASVAPLDAIESGFALDIGMMFLVSILLTLSLLIWGGLRRTSGLILLTALGFYIRFSLL
ncbi:MAG: calcium/sodium antiporter [Spirochaeta sp.]